MYIMPQTAAPARSMSLPVLYIPLYDLAIKQITSRVVNLKANSLKIWYKSQKLE